MGWEYIDHYHWKLNGQHTKDGTPFEPDACPLDAALVVEVIGLLNKQKEYCDALWELVNPKAETDEALVNAYLVGVDLASWLMFNAASAKPLHICQAALKATE